MPTFKYKVPLEGQPDQIVGCEMFTREDLAKVPNVRGGFFQRFVEKGVYVDYAVPLVDTTDIRASRLRVKKADGVFALSKGDYVDGDWVRKATSVSSDKHTFFVNRLKRKPADASGVNGRVLVSLHAPAVYQPTRDVIVRLSIDGGDFRTIFDSPQLWSWSDNYHNSYSFYAKEYFTVYWFGSSATDVDVEVLE